MNYLKSLEFLGLNQKEQDIYFALLQLEKATANQIATHAQIKRPTAYDILSRLQKEGFIYETVEGKKRFFLANPPQKILEIIENQKKNVEHDLPFLLSIYNTKSQRPKVAYFEGEEGIKQLTEDTLTTMQSGDEILAFVTTETLESMPEYAGDYVNRRVAKKISLRGIYNESPQILSYLKDDAKQLRTSRVVSPSQFPFKNEINIYANKIIIITYKPSPYGVLIESAEIAQTMRTLFELSWAGASQRR